jgi:hypothetical protein
MHGSMRRREESGAQSAMPREASASRRPYSERASRAVPQDCSFAKKQESASALLVVVPSGRLVAAG